jgi:hypothetical protein
VAAPVDGRAASRGRPGGPQSGLGVQWPVERRVPGRAAPNPLMQPTNAPPGGNNGP